jgi:prepilin-type N-terminal cleavage/methylation domain-containing protein
MSCIRTGLANKDSQGFTIVEVSLVMVILGIMAALTIVKYGSTMRNNELEKAANTVYMELRSARALAFKWDTPTFIKFYPDSITSWVDTNNNSKCDNHDIYKVIKLPALIRVGQPSKPPITGPFKDNITTSGKTGKWVDSLIIRPNSQEIYSTGAVYLYSKKIPTVTYCIGDSSGMQTLYFFKWTSNSWKKL